LSLIAQCLSLRITDCKSDAIYVNFTQIRIFGLFLNGLDKVANGDFSCIELLGEDGKLLVFTIDNFDA